MVCARSGRRAKRRPPGRSPPRAACAANSAPSGAALVETAFFRDSRAMISLGVDCGTSGLKAVLIDADGAAIASAASGYRPDHPRPQWSEQDPEVWVAAMFAALADLKRSAPNAFAAIGAIGFSGQMHGAVLLGRDGRALRPAMLHNDT